MVNAIIFGAPGSGKGTYASRLQSKLGVNVIAMGDIFREIMKEDTDLGREVKGYVEKGLLGPDSLTTSIIIMSFFQDNTRLLDQISLDQN